jgi:hypothetical protein
MDSLLLLHEVASLLRLSERRCRALVLNGTLRAKRLSDNGRLLFDAADVQAALRDARRPGAARSPS